mgnify:CR=1 FL=1
MLEFLHSYIPMFHRLYAQLHHGLADKHHIDHIAEMVSAYLLSRSCSLTDWLPLLP